MIYYQCVFPQVKIEQMQKLPQIVKNGMSCVNCPISQQVQKVDKMYKVFPFLSCDKDLVKQNGNLSALVLGSDKQTDRASAVSFVSRVLN